MNFVRIGNRFINLDNVTFISFHAANCNVWFNVPAIENTLDGNPYSEMEYLEFEGEERIKLEEWLTRASLAIFNPIEEARKELGKQPKKGGEA